MSENKKVKNILMVAPNLRVSNGVTRFIMNNYAVVKAANYDIDFLLTRQVESPYNDYVANSGSSIYVWPNYESKYSMSNTNYIGKVFDKKKYDIVHCNETGIYAYRAIKTASKAGVKHIIYHAHNPKETASIKGIAREILFDHLSFPFATDFFSCTDAAGKSVFGNERYTVVNNGIDFENYIFDQEKRNKLRTELGLGNKIVVGTVCRQAEQKNPFFTLDITRELLKKSKDIILLWVGSGPLIDECKKYVDRYHMNESVCFLQDRSDVAQLYSAMDCFLLPSKYEGLGIVFIEAQASGLYCFASNRVPTDTRITKNIEYLSLKKNAAFWADEIFHCIVNSKVDRLSAYNEARKNGVDIKKGNEMLLKAYKLLED